MPYKNMQHTAGKQASRQAGKLATRKTDCMQDATHNMQRARCNAQRTTCKMQHTMHKMQHAGDGPPASELHEEVMVHVEVRVRDGVRG